MTDRELKRLSRAELLELLLAQTEENEKLKKQIAQMRAQLEDRRILLDEAGSIAEAAMRLSGVFEAAETAAARYLENIKRLSGEREARRQDGAKESVRAENDGSSQKDGTEAELSYRQVMAEYGAY